MSHAPGLTFAIAVRFLGARENRFARFVTWVSFVGLTLRVTRPRLSHWKVVTCPSSLTTSVALPLASRVIVVV